MKIKEYYLIHLTFKLHQNSDPVLRDWSLTEIQSYVVEALCISDYTKLFPVCNVEILQVTANKIEVVSSFSVDFCQFSTQSAENSLKWYLGFLLLFIKTDKLSINITIQSLG